MKTSPTKTTLKSKKPLRQGAGLRAKQPLKAKPTAKKRPAPTVAKLKKVADKWHSLATRYRFASYEDDEWRAHCITCNVVKPIKKLQCGHFMSRQHNSTRFLEENTAPQCYGCNIMQQGRQFEFGVQLDLLYGDGTANRMFKESKLLHQFNAEELTEIINYAKEQVKFYESMHS